MAENLVEKVSYIIWLTIYIVMYSGTCYGISITIEIPKYSTFIFMQNVLVYIKLVYMHSIHLCFPQALKCFH